MRIEYSKQFLKQIKKFDKPVSEFLAGKIKTILEHFEPNKCYGNIKPLKYIDDYGYRLRIGDYRVFFTLESNCKL